MGNGVMVLVAAGAGLLVIGGIVLFAVGYLRGLQARGLARALALAGTNTPSLLEPRALSFGFQSAGAAQLRGTGCLALTPERLVFAMWLPARDFLVERAQILEVDTAMSHLGKTQFTPLLRVRFRTPDGGEDVVAWRLADLGPWLVQLAPRRAPAAA